MLLRKLSKEIRANVSWDKPAQLRELLKTRANVSRERTPYFPKFP
jgi:hypothetical protein